MYQLKKRKIIKPTKVINSDGSTTIYYSDGSSITNGKPPPTKSAL